MNFRIGHGYDVHAFGDGDHVILAGVKIPFERGIIAHSDGDVIIHAVCDALLGALALGDIGDHFPDTDPRYKGVSSDDLLRKTYQLVTQKGWTITNADLTLIAESPKISSFKMSMRQNIASALNVAVDAISVKATTTEKLGFIGLKQGIAAHAIILLQLQEPPMILPSSS